ncbi:MAG: hypothetical protein IT305_17945 [Chloroflexi bacterium]|nr:hypothetical protein [Chloroflexota bacterium]
MPELPSLDDLHDLPPDDVLRAAQRYIEQGQAMMGEWDIFEGRPNTDQVPFLELTDVPDDQIAEDDDEYRSDPVLLLLVPEDEDSSEFADELMQQVLAGKCWVRGLGNGRFIVVGEHQAELALLTRGRGVWFRPEDLLDHCAGFELRDADGPPFSMQIYGHIDRPLPGRTPEHQLVLLCESIETRGGPTDRTHVLVDVMPWSISGANISLSADRIERMARNRVSVSITARPFAGRRKALSVVPDGDGILVPHPEEIMFYETLKREVRWLRARGEAPSWVPGDWTWQVETDLGWYLVDGDEEPRAMGFGGPLL